ncbi:MAG: SAM-dependent methyltransferase [Anaerolinea sp.]|nr:SAM-dependent methyltransferase [Anaerolinea sp.]
MSTETTNALASPEELVGRLVESAAGAMEIVSIYAGEKLGWYSSLVNDGPATPVELAARTATNERYAREWLEQQATAGFLTFTQDASGVNRFAMPPGYEAVLHDRQSELFVAPLGRFLVSAVANAGSALAAYRSGGGVPWEAFGEDMRTAQSDFNRPFFTNSLVPGYLSQIAEVHDALSAPGARVAEIGPGGGWAAIAVATAYPEARVDAFDLDHASVALARHNVAEAGLGDRVTVHHRDAGDPAIAGEFDLVCAFECIHDLSDPVSVLGTMRRLAKPGAPVVVMDERVAEEFGAVGDLFERLFYGFSLGVCLLDGMSAPKSAATGTVMRPSTLRGYARDAGFADIEILPLEHDMFCFYRLVH